VLFARLLRFQVCASFQTSRGSPQKWPIGATQNPANEFPQDRSSELDLEEDTELWYNSYTKMRFESDAQKSKRLKANPKRGIGFEEAQELFEHPYYLDQRSDMAEQYKNCTRLFFEVREDNNGEYYHLVPLCVSPTIERMSRVFSQTPGT
jgi:hypothetical protein